MNNIFFVSTAPLSLQCFLFLVFFSLFLSWFLFLNTRNFCCTALWECPKSERDFMSLFIMRPARDISRLLFNPLRLTKERTEIKFDLFREMEVDELLLYEDFFPLSFLHPTCCMWLLGRAGPWYVLSQEAAVSVINFMTPLMLPEKWRVRERHGDKLFW